MLESLKSKCWLVVLFTGGKMVQEGSDRVCTMYVKEKLDIIWQVFIGLWVWGWGFVIACLPPCFTPV